MGRLLQQLSLGALTTAIILLVWVSACTFCRLSAALRLPKQGLAIGLEARWTLEICSALHFRMQHKKKKVSKKKKVPGKDKVH